MSNNTIVEKTTKKSRSNNLGFNVNEVKNLAWNSFNNVTDSALVTYLKKAGLKVNPNGTVEVSGVVDSSVDTDKVEKLLDVLYSNENIETVDVVFAEQEKELNILITFSSS